jgi:hypothetical protein
MPPLPTRETRRQYAGYYGSRSETRAKAEFQHLHDAEDETRAKQGSSAVGKYMDWGSKKSKAMPGGQGNKVW